MPFKRTGILLSAGIITSLLSGGCRVVPADGSTPTPTLVSPGGVVTGLASVERVEIMMRESFPVKISALAIGSLPDSCTTLDQVTQEREENTFHITLATVRPSDQACAAATVPFQKAVEIESVGLKAGIYTVIVNGVNAEFELQADNILSESPPSAVSPKPAGTDPSGSTTPGYPEPQFPPPSLPEQGGYPTP